MEDIVERLRNARSREDSFVCNEAANEIESLRAQLAEVTGDRDELKTVPMKYRRMKFNAELQDENAKLHKQLLATQAHVARVVAGIAEYLQANDPDGFGCACTPDHKCGPCNEYDRQNPLHEALSTPINLDALHEALARECERLAHLFPRGSMHAHKMLEEAAYHMAKKDNHQ